jgi:agmatinase
MPTATGTAEVGGWTTRELLSILDGLTGLKVVGADIGILSVSSCRNLSADQFFLVEVAPIYDNAGETTVLAAAEVAHSLLGLMVRTPVKAS